jgi:hypothetical protein
MQPRLYVGDRFLDQRFAESGPSCHSFATMYGSIYAAMLCTASQSNTPIEQSAEALRDRGRLVIVGNTRTELSWKTFYEKEIEVRYSRSYGPGRYDAAYEWGGNDYPIGYVRWTEQRNFDACLHLMKSGQIDLSAITTRRVPFAKALEVYRDLVGEGAAKEVGVVLEYDTTESNQYPAISIQSGISSKILPDELKTEHWILAQSASATKSPTCEVEWPIFPAASD